MCMHKKNPTCHYYIVLHCLMLPLPLCSRLITGGVPSPTVYSEERPRHTHVTINTAALWRSVWGSSPRVNFNWWLRWRLFFPAAPRDDPLHVSLQERRPGGLYQSTQVLSFTPRTDGWTPSPSFCLFSTQTPLKVPTQLIGLFLSYHFMFFKETFIVYFC